MGLLQHDCKIVSKQPLIIKAQRLHSEDRCGLFLWRRWIYALQGVWHTLFHLFSHLQSHWAPPGEILFLQRVQHRRHRKGRIFIRGNDRIGPLYQ